MKRGPKPKPPPPPGSRLFVVGWKFGDGTCVMFDDPVELGGEESVKKQENRFDISAEDYDLILGQAKKHGLTPERYLHQALEAYVRYHHPLVVGKLHKCVEAVACPQCHSEKGEPCKSALVGKVYMQETHVYRRNAYMKLKKEKREAERQAAIASLRAQGVPLSKWPPCRFCDYPIAPDEAGHKKCIERENGGLCEVLPAPPPLPQSEATVEDALGNTDSHAS